MPEVRVREGRGHRGRSGGGLGTLAVWAVVMLSWTHFSKRIKFFTFNMRNVSNASYTSVKLLVVRVRERHLSGSQIPATGRMRPPANTVQLPRDAAPSREGCRQSRRGRGVRTGRAECISDGPH